MKKGNYVLNVKSFVGQREDFLPNYQFEKPLDFSALVSHYMERYWDSEKEPEKYLSKLKYAARYANKSIMLEKLGIESYEDLEEHEGEAFKSVFVDLAKADPELVVNGSTIKYSPNLQKSLTATDPASNERYEQLWKKTFDTLKSRRA